MKTTKRKSSEVRNRGSRPMRGGLLSDIAHAFRLRVAVVGENGDVAVGTAKHAFNDHRDVGRGRHIALVRAVVDRLFTTEYLVSRGLTPGEATRHNDHVTQAMDVILAAWDRLGVFHNVTPEKLERVEAVMGPLGLLGVELPIRIAAYHARYGFLHPVCSDLASWVRAPGIRGWGTHVSRQVRTPIVPSALYRRGELDGHTVRDLLEGRALPMEQTVRPLAARIAEHGVRDRDHAHDVHPAEVEFELRVAIAVAEHRALVTSLIDGSDGTSLLLRALHRVLVGAPDAVAEDLLVHGAQSAAFSEVMGHVPTTLTIIAFESAGGERDRNDAHPLEPLRRMAEDYRRQANYLRNIDTSPGADGPEKRVAEHWEHAASVALAVVAGGGLSTPPLRPDLRAELEADRLCLEAIAPTLNLSLEEKEARLREAVRRCPHLAYARRSLAAHLSSTARLEEARSEYRRALSLNPAHVGGRETLVLIAAHFGDHGDVLALTDDSQVSVILRSARAHVFCQRGELDEGERLAREVLSSHPRHPPALRVLAACVRARGGGRVAHELELKADFYERGVEPPGS